MLKPDQKRSWRGMWWDRALRLVGGCTKLGPECDHCWAETETEMRRNHPNEKVAARYQGDFTGDVVLYDNLIDTPTKTTKPQVWAIWNDLFHESVPIPHILKAWAMFVFNPQHVFIVCTKRAKRMHDFTNFLKNTDQLERTIKTQYGEHLAAMCVKNGYLKEPLPNVIGMTTVGTMKRVHELHWLCESWLAKKAVSAEPLLEPLDLSIYLNRLDWVIAGCESGKDRRPTPIEAFERLHADCMCHKVAFWMKQVDVDGKVEKEMDKIPSNLRRRQWADGSLIGW